MVRHVHSGGLSAGQQKQTWFCEHDCLRPDRLGDGVPHAKQCYPDWQPDLFGTQCPGLVRVAGRRKTNSQSSPIKPLYQIIEAPSILGLKPSGVELLPYALQRAGFLKQAANIISVPVDVTDFSPQRPTRHDVLNAERIAGYARRLADAIPPVLANGRFPVVLGGDCSILLGCMLALKETGPLGLAHMDAHADFYQPEAEPTGEAASMDLALVVGRGPDLLTNIDHQRPYVQEKHVVQLGQRDAEEAKEAGNQDINDSAIQCFDLQTIRVHGVDRVIANAIRHLTAEGLAGFWIHFDVDVLADDIMPAVDYRLPGGLTFGEATALLRGLLQTTKAVGVSISIFNPKLDPDGTLTRQLVDCLHGALLTDEGQP